MTIATTFGAFLAEPAADALPDQTLDHAAMIVASTLAKKPCPTIRRMIP